MLAVVVAGGPARYSILITVPAAIAEPVLFFQITKFSVERALVAVLWELGATPLNPLSVNLIIMFGLMSTQFTKEKLSGVVELIPRMLMSPAAKNSWAVTKVCCGVE